MRLPIPLKRLLSKFRGARHVARLQREAVAMELLTDNLTAWEGEEESVQEEHAPLIERLRAFVRGEV